MRKRKIEVMEVIQNPVSRNVTYCKRKRGLVRKAMEISVLCDQQVFLVICDKEKEKLVFYRSSNDFDDKCL